MRRQFTIYASSNSNDDYWSKAKSSDPIVREDVAWDKSIPEDVYLYMAENEEDASVQAALHDNEMLLNASDDFYMKLANIDKPYILHTIIWYSDSPEAATLKAIRNCSRCKFGESGFGGDLAGEVVAYFVNGELVYHGIDDESPKDLSLCSAMFGYNDIDWYWDDSTQSYHASTDEGDDLEAICVNVE